jgi:hypothetical protein
MQLPRRVQRGERMRIGTRYKIVSQGAKVGFRGTLVARFPAEGESWALFRNVK